MVALKIPKVTFQPPTFNSVEEERRHRKQRLAAAFDYLPASDSAKELPDISPSATPNTSTISGSILLECTLV
jgi:hypothetical protein